MKKLSQQQQRRIKQNQQQQLTALGSEQYGLVIAHYGQLVTIETDEGQLMPCYVQNSVDGVVVGDKIIWQTVAEDTDKGLVVGRVERTSLLARPDKYKGKKLIAANITQVIIVVSVVPELVPFFIDKYLVASEAQHLPATILFNKIDLTETATAANNFITEVGALYEKLGYRVIQASALTQAGLAELKSVLQNNCSIFVGQSGAGKSSLLNALCGEELAKTAEISSANKKGKHTTTTAYYYHTEDAGDIIDSPGIREFGLWHLNPQDIMHGFVEFFAYLGHCRYKNCEHLNDTPGCAILSALQKGTISQSRYDSYLRILNES